MQPERFARDVTDSKTYPVPGDMTYKQWKAEQDRLHGAGTVDRVRKKRYNTSADIEQYNKYKSILGKNAPKSFAAFQEIKYSGDYDGLKRQLVSSNKGKYLQEALSYRVNDEEFFIPALAVFEKVVVIAGTGSKAAIKDVKRLVLRYGGAESEWMKKAGKISSSRIDFDVHWYERDDGIQREAKIKKWREKR